MDVSRNSTISGVVRRSNTRHLILALLFIITTLNYADRATLSITGSVIRQQFGMDAIQMGYIFSAFSWAYVICQLPCGWLLDRFGAKRVYATSILVWSAFTFLQGTIGAFGSAAAAITALMLMRIAVGVAEAPAFPANAKVVSEWYPAAERGTASAIFNSAQYFAAVVFTPLMAWITHAFGWTHVYFVMGLLGIALGGVWLKTMKSPSQHPRVNRAELDYIQGTDEASRQNVGTTTVTPIKKASGLRNLKSLLSHRMLLGIYMAQYCVNVLTYFFLTWFPIYLVQARGMTILKAGLVASLPAICGFVGGVLGGIISDMLIKRGFTLTAARKIPIVGGMLLSMVIIGCNYVSTDWIVIALMALAFFGKGIGALGWAVIADTAPREAMGLSGSIFNMFGNIAGIVTPIVIGYIVNVSHSFNGALIFVGAHGLIAVICYLVIVKDIKRVELRPALA
jgi:ACS family glucarate transporter-like MFS transporter/ACS family D-galactonate transporter-like MFS transporter